MEKKIKVKIIGNGLSTYREKRFKTLFEDEGFEIVETFPESDIMVFCKSGTLNPFFYAEPLGPKDDALTQNRSIQDTVVDLFMLKVAEKKFKIGFEQGAFFLASLSKCDIIDVTEHVGTYHTIALLNDTNYNGYYESNHSQLMYPYTLPKDQFEILGISKHASKYYKGRLHNEKTEIDVLEDDVEICYFNKTNSLCLSLGPEMCSQMGQKMIFNIIKDKYNEYQTSRDSLLHKSK